MKLTRTLALVLTGLSLGLVFIVMSRDVPVVQAADAWVHGVVQDTAYQGVPGCTARLWTTTGVDWRLQAENVLPSAYFGWGVRGNVTAIKIDVIPVTGYAKPPIQTFARKDIPLGNIIFTLVRIEIPTQTPEPTVTLSPTQMPPTVPPWTPGATRTATVTMTPGPSPTYTGFLQLTDQEMLAVVAQARQEMAHELEPLSEIMDNCLWLAGADFDLGAPMTRCFDAAGYHCIGFSHNIVVMRDGDDRVGIISWFGCFAYGGGMYP